MDSALGSGPWFHSEYEQNSRLLQHPHPFRIVRERKAIHEWGTRVQTGGTLMRYPGKRRVRQFMLPLTLVRIPAGHLHTPDTGQSRLGEPWWVCDLFRRWRNRRLGSRYGCMKVQQASGLAGPLTGMTKCPSRILKKNPIISIYFHQSIPWPLKSPASTYYILYIIYYIYISWNLD